MTTIPTLNHPDLQPAASATNAYPADIAQFNLLIARVRNNERSPHYFGSVKIEGKWYQVSTWIRHSATTGEQMLSNSIRPCTAEEAQRHEARDQEFRARQQPATAPATNPMHNTVAQPQATQPVNAHEPF